MGHLVLGGCMFLGLVFISGGIHVAVHWSGTFFGADFVGMVEPLEVFMLYADMFFFAWWVVYSTYRAIKGLKE